MIHKGYTLIELTIVVGLVAILSIGISSAVLMNTITALRTRNLTKLRNNGNYSLNQLKTMLRNARSIDTCNQSNNSFSITSYDGGSTLIALELDNGVGRIASNSGSYLTPADTEVSNFQIACIPDEVTPRSINISFDSNLVGLPSGRDNPTVPFQTAVTLRND